MKINPEFKVKVEKDPEGYDLVLLRITFNGYQWQVIGLENIFQVKEIIQVLTCFLDELKEPKNA